MRKKERKILNAKCRICGKEFYVRPNHLRRGWGKYCSWKCKCKAQLKGKFVYCETCGKKIWRMPRDLKHSKSEKFFCNKTCQTIWRNKVYSGPNHPFWTGGESVYRKILMENGISPICARCKEKDQRVLTVHHKDKNRYNNKTKNLIWLCLNCHYLIHHHNEPVN